MSEASVSVRLNPFKNSEGLFQDCQTVPWNKYGRILQERPSFTLDPLFHAGCYYVQDSSAMYVGHIFRRVIDLAFPGGQRLINLPLRSIPSLPSVVPPVLLRNASSRLGIGNPLPLHSTAASVHMATGGHRFQSLSHPETPTIKVLDLCAAPGGKTTDLAASLREVYGDDFLLVSNEVMKARASVLNDNVALWGDPNVVVTSVDPAAFAQFPGFFDIIVADVPCSGEGMFRKDQRAVDEWSPEVVELCAARQKRIVADVWPALKQDGYLIYSTCTYEKCENDDNLLWAATELGGEILPVTNEFADYGVEATEYGNLLRAGVVPGEGQWVGALRKTAPQGSIKNPDLAKLRPLRSGVIKGEQKGNKLIPSADYALNLAYEGEYPSYELDRKMALKFLHRDTFSLPDAPRGFVLMCYEGHPLGFVNNLGTRCNNLHPQGRRILMNVE